MINKNGLFGRRILFCQALFDFGANESPVH